jgi:hypothetical protein
MSAPPDIQAIYERAIAVEGKYPYAYGGGHDSTFTPSPPLHGGAPGYDCSSFLSMLIHAGAPGEMPAPLTTGGFENWGFEGAGDYFAVRVYDGWHNGRLIEHVLGEFRSGFPSAHRFVMAFYTGGPPCGFLAANEFDPSFYRTRRKRVG